MTLTRRSALKGLVAAGVASSTVSCVRPTPGNETSVPKLVVPSAPASLLLNRSRAVEVMESAGVDLLLCADSVNIHYLTNQQPVTFDLGMDGLTYAALAASGKQKPALFTGQITYYFYAADRPVSDLIDLRFYSSPAEPDLFEAIDRVADLVDAPAVPGFMPRIHKTYPQSASEVFRRKQVEVALSQISPSVEAALLRYILESDLPNRTIAIDDQKLRAVVERSGLDIRVVDGERLIRRIRLQKTPAEIEIVRYIAAANANAGLVAAQKVRDGASLLELRAEYAKECGKRMCNARYMMIDGHAPDLATGEISEGRSFLIDCVSEFQGYHGDYGRTVCVGEPTREMQSIIDTLSGVWDRILPELLPGFAYSDISSLAAKLFAESGIDAGFAVNPHNVGLHHTDEPGAREFSSFTKENIVLAEGMVLSVDLPFLDTGLGGSAHLEDLVLIGKDGPELLNDSGNRFIVA